jgi:hypothetical protein
MGCDGRTSPSAMIARTNGVCADGEVVRSWRSDAGAKVVKTLSRLTGDGGNQAWPPRRARRKPLKPLCREGRVSSAEPVVLPRAFLLHADHGCQPVPGLPCALSLSEGLAFAKLGRRRRRENARPWLFDIGIDGNFPLRASDCGDGRRRVKQQVDLHVRGMTSYILRRDNAVARTNVVEA